MHILKIADDDTQEQPNLSTSRRNPIKYLAEQYKKWFRPKSSNRHLEQDANGPFPFLILIISGIQLLVFNYDLVQTNEHKSNLTIQYIGLSDIGPAASLLIIDPNKRFEFWRYLTYIFVNFGFFNLAVNIILQLYLGMSLEMVHGCKRFFCFYTISVIVASGTVSLMSPKIYLAGGSGGVYALFGAHIAAIFNNWKKNEPAYPELFGIAFLALIDIGRSVSSNHPTISYKCHLVGIIAGFITGLAINKKLKRPIKFPKHFWKCFIIAVGLLALIYGVLQFYINRFEMDVSMARTSTTSQKLHISQEFTYYNSFK